MVRAILILAYPISPPPLFISSKTLYINLGCQRHMPCSHSPHHVLKASPYIRNSSAVNADTCRTITLMQLSKNSARVCKEKLVRMNICQVLSKRAPHTNSMCPLKRPRGLESHMRPDQSSSFPLNPKLASMQSQHITIPLPFPPSSLPHLVPVVPTGHQISPFLA